MLGLGVVEFKKGNSVVTSEQMEGDKKDAPVQPPAEVQGKASGAMPQRTETHPRDHNPPF